MQIALNYMYANIILGLGSKTVLAYFIGNKNAHLLPLFHKLPAPNTATVTGKKRL